MIHERKCAVRRLIFLVSIALMLVSPLALQAQADAQFGYQTVYIVQPGDTLYRIARAFGVLPEAIAAANNIFNFNLIYVGQRLVIPGATNPPPQYQIHIVRLGDTLARIARQYGTTVAAIASANGISNVNRIFVGQRLIIPGGYYPPPQQNVVTYYVQRGDRLVNIARRFGTTVQAIVAYNGIRNPDRIFAGQVLYIPLYRYY